MSRLVSLSALPIHFTLVLFFLVVTSLMFAYAPVPPHSPVSIDMSTLRQLVTADNGLKPLEIRTANSAVAAIPRSLAVAGYSAEFVQLAMPVYQVNYPNYSLMIDAGIADVSQFVELVPQLPVFDSVIKQGLVKISNRLSLFEENEDGKNDIRTALKEAQTIILSSAQPTHSGALLSQSAPKLTAQQLLLSASQVRALNRWSSDKFESNQVYGNIDNETAFQLIAPGVVTGSLGGGSQIIYVQLHSGQEYLFVGDIVWQSANLNEQRARPKFTSEWLLGEDSALASQQIRAVINLQSQNQPMHIVISNDHNQWQRLVQQGVINKGLRLKPKTLFGGS